MRQPIPFVSAPRAGPPLVAAPDLSQDPPQTLHRAPVVGPPAWLDNPDLQRLRRQGRPSPPLRQYQRTDFLAEGVANLEAQQRANPASIGDIPLTQRAAAGVDMNSGHAVYDERARPLSDLYSDVGRMTGVRPEFLRALSAHESGEDPQARPPINPATGKRRSEAYGLNQFTPQTWDDTASAHGAAIGYPAFTPGEQTHQDRRGDPRWSLAMSAELADENAQNLRPAIGRTPTEREVYLAHFAGPSRAAAWIRADRTWKGSLPAANFVDPGYVQSNPEIFLTPEGRQRSVHDVITLLGRDFSDRPFVRNRGR